MNKDKIKPLTLVDFKKEKEREMTDFVHFINSKKIYSFDEVNDVMSCKNWG